LYFRSDYSFLSFSNSDWLILILILVLVLGVYDEDVKIKGLLEDIEFILTLAWIDSDT